MQQDDNRPIDRAFIDDVEDKLTATVLVHALSMPHRMSNALGLVVIGRTPIGPTLYGGLGLALVGWGSPHGVDDRAICDRQLTHRLKTVALV